MKSYPIDADHTSDYIVPFAANNEFAEMFGVIHSLDLYNFVAASLTVSKLDQGATGDIRITGSETPRAVVVSDAQLNSDVYAIPNDGGGNWVERITTGDGILQVTIQGWASNLFGGAPLWMGVRVDGVLAAQSGTASSGLGIASAWFAQAEVPVGAGEHIVEAVFGFYSIGGGVTTITWQDRTMIMRELAR